MDDASGPKGAATSYFDQAAAVLERAMKATGLAEQALLLDEALRLHRLGLAEERAKLKQLRKSIEPPGG